MQLSLAFSIYLVCVLLKYKFCKTSLPHLLLAFHPEVFTIFLKMTPAPLPKPHILFTGKIAAFFKKQTERKVQNASKLLLKRTIQEDHEKQFLKGIYIHTGQQKHSSGSGANSQSHSGLHI